MTDEERDLVILAASSLYMAEAKDWCGAKGSAQIFRSTAKQALRKLLGDANLAELRGERQEEYLTARDGLRETAQGYYDDPSWHGRLDPMVAEHQEVIAQIKAEEGQKIPQ